MSWGCQALLPDDGPVTAWPGQLVGHALSLPHSPPAPILSVPSGPGHPSPTLQRGPHQMPSCLFRPQDRSSHMPHLLSWCPFHSCCPREDSAVGLASRVGAGQHLVPPLLLGRSTGSVWEVVLVPVRGAIGGPQVVYDPCINSLSWHCNSFSSVMVWVVSSKQQVTIYSPWPCASAAFSCT